MQRKEQKKPACAQKKKKKKITKVAITISEEATKVGQVGCAENAQQLLLEQTTSDISRDTRQNSKYQKHRTTTSKWLK